MGSKKKWFWKFALTIIWNKYFISLIVVIIWVSFFDKDDLMSQYELRQKLGQLRIERNYFVEEIKRSKNDMNELKTNRKNLEKFAREKYLMKKESEEIFIIVKDSSKTFKEPSTP